MNRNTTKRLNEQKHKRAEIRCCVKSLYDETSRRKLKHIVIGKKILKHEKITIASRSHVINCFMTGYFIDKKQLRDSLFKYD